MTSSLTLRKLLHVLRHLGPGHLGILTNGDLTLLPEKVKASLGTYIIIVLRGNKTNNSLGYFVLLIINFEVRVTFLKGHNFLVAHGLVLIKLAETTDDLIR